MLGWMRFAAPAVAASTLLTLSAADAREDFEMRVRPLLVKSCFPCHTQARLGGLRLDSREAILKGGGSGPAAVPGQPDQSLLVKAVAHAGALKMPPTGRLASAEIDLLRNWVKEGLYWPPEEKPAAPAAEGSVIRPEQRAWWAFQPVKKTAPPALRNTAWAITGIDRFLLARMEAAGVKPLPETDRRTWLRRVTLTLTGLPPSAAEVYAFLNDRSPAAHERVVDRLLASPRYGEAWARHWLDVARYSDDKLNSTQDEPHPNAFRFRNWVIDAFNQDLPYDLFVKAQIAGDLLPASRPEEFEPALGFFAMSPEFQDDRVDALTRGFLATTVACAQCHDHKFDPIPTKDYYALQGIFASSHVHETPLAPAGEVEAWQAKKKTLDRAQERLTRFYAAQTDAVAEMLASRTADYILAAEGLGPAAGLEAESIERVRKMLPEWKALWPANASGAVKRDAAAALQKKVLETIEAKRRVDKENEIRLGLDPGRADLANANLVSLDRDTYAFWRDLFGRSEKDSAGFFQSPDGVFYYGRGKVERFLQGTYRDHLELLKREVEEARKALPEQYPFLHTLRDNEKAGDVHVAIRGDRNNKGPLAPRAFLSVLARDEPVPFRKGSGRLELAEAIASPENPLTARVIVNRVWAWHFGRGLAATPSNFGRLGEAPSHPELLDALAARLVEQGWSIKKLQREIVLSRVYRLASHGHELNEKTDPANRLLWRWPRRRLEIETLRDALLAASGQLDVTPAGKAAPLDDHNRRRTVYGFVSRRRLHPVLGLFDFPNPNNTAEQRVPTNVPPQRLWLMNSSFVEAQAAALEKALPAAAGEARVRELYARLWGREPAKDELKLALDFTGAAPPAAREWVQLTRALLTSNEFLYLD